MSPFITRPVVPSRRRGLVWAGRPGSRRDISHAGWPPIAAPARKRQCRGGPATRRQQRRRPCRHTRAVHAGGGRVAREGAHAPAAIVYTSPLRLNRHQTHPRAENGRGGVKGRELPYLISAAAWNGLEDLSNAESRQNPDMALFITDRCKNPEQGCLEGEPKETALPSLPVMGPNKEAGTEELSCLQETPLLFRRRILIAGYYPYSRAWGRPWEQSARLVRLPQPLASWRHGDLARQSSWTAAAGN